MVSKLMKWTKRLVIFALIIYMFDFFLFDIQNTSKKIKMISTSKSMKESIIASKKSSINKVQMEKKEDKELKKPDCFHNNTYRAGPVAVNLSAENMKTIENLFASTVSSGGRYAPPDCKSSQRIAVIIPYRDREDHLKFFLRHMHPFLQRQQLDYAIFVIEMDKNLRFNRAMLKNIGFIEAMKLFNYTCFVFNDVDTLPEDDRIPYSCANMPQHLSVAIDKFNYRLPYKTIFGGAFSFRTEHFRKVNGMSNMFFGWGGEDDDLGKRFHLSHWPKLSQKRWVQRSGGGAFVAEAVDKYGFQFIFRCHRVVLNGLRIVRPPTSIARYKTIKHTHDQDKNPQRHCLLRSVQQRMSRDGLSNIKYSVEQLELRPLYTWVLVTVNETQQIQPDDFLFTFYKRCAGNNKNNPKNMFKIKTLPTEVISTANVKRWSLYNKLQRRTARAPSGLYLDISDSQQDTSAANA